MACKRTFQSMPLWIVPPSKMCHSPSLSSQVCLEHLVWRCQEGAIGDICDGEGKAYVMGLRHVVSVYSLFGEALARFCWTTWPWYWALRRGVAPHQVSITRVAKFESSLLPRSPFLSADGLRLKIDPADEPSRSKRYRANMHHDVDQCRPSATVVSP